VKFMRTNLCILSIFFSLVLLISLTSTNVSATIIGTPAPTNGDWIINNATTVTDETIIMDGDIIVNDGGSLVLDGTTIKMNCSTDGQYGITVKKGGTFTIKDSSLITKNGSKNYFLIVHKGASFSMDDSTIEYCGYEMEDYDKNKGWMYSGPYFACDGTITDSIIDYCLQGVIAEDNTFTVRGSTVKNSLWHNIEGRNTKNFILENCDFLYSIEKCNVEFYAGCTGSIKNCTVTGAGHNTIWCMTNNTVVIENNVLTQSPYNGIWAADNCDLTIKNNIIKNNDQSGIWIEQNCKVVCTGNTIKDNGDTEAETWKIEQTGHGFAGFDSDVIFSDNIVGNNYGHNFETTRCTATFENNNFTASRQKCNVEFFDESVIIARNNYIDGAGHNCFWVRDGVKATIEGNIMKNSPHNGIWAGNHSELIIRNNVIDNCAENGIYSYNCTLTIENNEIKNCGDYGIYTEGCDITRTDNTYASVTKGEKKLCFYIFFKTVDKENAELGETNLVLKDSSGETIWSGSSNLKGTTSEIFVTDTETYTLEADWGDFTGTKEFTPDKNGQYLIELKESKEDSDNNLYIIVGIIIIIVIIVIIAGLSKRGKSNK
jgi:hypothetical protein